MSSILNNASGMQNIEPGADLFQSMVFGNTADSEMPTDLEDPISTLDEDVKAHREFVVESDRRFAAVIRKLNYLEEKRFMTRSLAAECASIMPNFLQKRRIETYTTTPSATNYVFAVESMHWAAWGLIAAAIAALAALGWKLYRVITGESDSSSGGGGGGGGAMSEAEVTAAAEKKAKEATSVVTGRQERSVAYSEITKQLNDILLNQDGLMKITEEVMGVDVFKNLDSEYKKPDGIKIDLKVANKLILAHFNAEGSYEYKLLRGITDTPASYMFFVKSDRGTLISTILAELRDDFSKIFAKIDEVLASYDNIDTADEAAMMAAEQGSKEAINELTRYIRVGPVTDGNKLDNSEIGSKINNLKKLLTETGGETATAPIPLDRILEVASGSENDPFNSLFKMAQDAIYIGDDALTKKIGHCNVKMQKFSDMVTKRVDTKVPRDRTTPEGASEANRDKSAVATKQMLGYLQTSMNAAKDELRVVNDFCNSVKQLDKTIGKVVTQLLSILSKIYTSNGKQTKTFTELANKISAGLKSGVKFSQN